MCFRQRRGPGNVNVREDGPHEKGRDVSSRMSRIRYGGVS